MHDDLNQLLLGELFDRLVDETELSRRIEAARREDLGNRGDITSELLVPAGAQAEGVFRPRAAGVLAGARLLERIAAAYDPALWVSVVISDGTTLSAGDIIAAVAGRLRSILAAERVMLNFLTHLSGIATLTARYAEAVAGTPARIYDTRKTVPGLRALAKYAVRCGGGYCHRLGLYDAVLIKDNHLAHIPPDELREQLTRAVQSAHAADPPPVFIEAEADTLAQLADLLAAGADIALLDNMTTSELAEAVSIRDQRAPEVLLEASGGVELDRVRGIAECGVDRIAVGALTHSAPALDIGLDITADETGPRE